MPKRSEQKPYLLEIIRENGGSMRRREMVDEVPFSASRLDNILHELVKTDRLERGERQGLYNLPRSADLPSRSIPKTPANSFTDLFHEDVELDVYTDIRVEGGDGRVVYPDEAKRKIRVPRQFISKIIGFVPPSQVGMMMVEGDSMHPTIQEDDMVLWRPVDEVRGGGVYVLSIDGALVVKRVHKIPGGGLELISDNDYHGYPNYTLVPEEDTLINTDTGNSVALHPVGKVLFPRRDTDRMHVKQVAEIVRSVANGDLDMKQLQ